MGYKLTLSSSTTNNVAGKLWKTTWNYEYINVGFFNLPIFKMLNYVKLLAKKNILESSSFLFKILLFKKRENE